MTEPLKDILDMDTACSRAILPLIQQYDTCLIELDTIRTTGAMSERDASASKYLEQWIENYAAPMMLKTLQILPDKASEKISGFTSCYGYLLSEAYGSIPSLIDLLYAIPRQFRKDVQEFLPDGTEKDAIPRKPMETLSEIIGGDRIKCVVCDFDDTLFAWSDVAGFDSEEFEASFLNGNGFYEEHRDCIRPIDFMQSFCRMLVEMPGFRIKRMICLTQTKNQVSLPYKKKELDKAYPDIFDDILCAPTQEAKLEVLEAIAMKNGFKREEILLIDDRIDMRDMASTAGFRATSPIAIYSVFFMKNK